MIVIYGNTWQRIELASLRIHCKELRIKLEITEMYLCVLTWFSRLFLRNAFDIYVPVSSPADQVITFCNKTGLGIEHNSDVPNPHNDRCGGRSAWEVLLEHPDFREHTGESTANDGWRHMSVLLYYSEAVCNYQ